MVRSLWMGLLLVGIAGCGTAEAGKQVEGEPSSPAAGQAAKVELKPVKYDELTGAIRALEGKVVVVDIWASWCAPCKKEFPHLVELHQKHARDGSVAVSVSVDALEDAPKAVEFLKKQTAAFPNYLIDESDEVWQPRWRFKGVPAVFVFDRQGYRAGKFTNDDPKSQFTYAKNVVPLVEKLLGEK